MEHITKKTLTRKFFPHSYGNNARFQFILKYCISEYAGVYTVHTNQSALSVLLFSSRFRNLNKEVGCKLASQLDVLHIINLLHCLSSE